MNANLLAIVKQIVADQGEGILSEPRRVSAFFADLARDVPKPQKNAFVKCLEHGLAQTLKEAAESDRENCKERLAQKLHEEEGLDPGLCADTIRLLAAVLFGEEQKKSFCKNCGKELQEGWKACPYCSAQAAAKTSQIISSVISSESGSGGYGVEQIKPDSSEIASAFTDNTDDITQKCDNCFYISLSRNECTRYKLPLYEAAKNEHCRTSPVDKENNIPFTQGNESNIENTQLRERLKKTKTALVWAIILGIFGLVISIATGVTNYNEMSGRYWNMNWQYNEIKSNYDTLLANYEKSKSLWKIEITSIKVGNWNNGSWISRPGEALSSEKMRYFEPVITYNSTIGEDVTFYVKIINPNGTLSNNPSTSPVGYTYTTKARVNRGSNQSLDLTGWGNSDSSSYTAGTWTVEVWYSDVCLKSEKIIIEQ